MTYTQCVAKCVRAACLQRQIVEVKFKPTKRDRQTHGRKKGEGMGEGGFIQTKELCAYFRLLPVWAAHWLNRQFGRWPGSPKMEAGASFISISELRSLPKFFFEKKDKKNSKMGQAWLVDALHKAAKKLVIKMCIYIYQIFKIDFKRLYNIVPYCPSYNCKYSWSGSQLIYYRVFKKWLQWVRLNFRRSLSKPWNRPTSWLSSLKWTKLLGKKIERKRKKICKCIWMN